MRNVMRVFLEPEQHARKLRDNEDLRSGLKNAEARNGRKKSTMQTLAKKYGQEETILI
jgi:hypothetical protein